MQAFFIVVAHAAVGAGMRTERTRDKRQRISLQDDLKRILCPALFHRMQVSRDILADRAVRTAGCGEAVKQREFFAVFPVRKRLQGFPVTRVRFRISRQFFRLLYIHAAERPGSAVLEKTGDLGHSLIAARLQDRGRHRDRPDARVKDPANVEIIGAAGIRNPKLATELLGNAPAHFNREREQGAARHIHFLARQFLRPDIHREGVGELDAKFQTFLFSQSDQALEHRNGICPLQILQEMVIIESNVAKAQIIERLPGKFITEERRIAFYIRMQMLLRDQIGRNALDLSRRTSVQSGFGNGFRDLYREAFNPSGIGLLKLPLLRRLYGYRFALSVNVRTGSILHVFYIAVNLWRLNPFQIIADRHVEDKSFRVAKPELPGQDPAQEPGFYIFLIGLADFKFG